MAAADLNGDTKPDLVLADALAGQIHVLINNGTGCFSSVSDTDVLNFGRPYATSRWLIQTTWEAHDCCWNNAS